MNKAPIVTIAIPAFNLARYIKAVIDYVLQKALQEWKILVFDCESCNTTLAGFVYATYGLDVAVRSLLCRLCTKVVGSTSVLKVRRVLS